MQTVKIKLYVFRHRGNDGAPHYDVRDYNCKLDNEIEVARTTLEIDIPDEEDLVPKEVQIIDELITKVRQDAEDKVRAAMDLKSKMLSITWEG